MFASPLPIHEIVGLLHSTNQDALTQLKEKYPEYADSLEPGITLGKNLSVADQKLIAFRLELCLAGLKEILTRTDLLIASLRTRIKRYRRVQLLSQVSIALGGASVFALLGQEIEWVTPLAAAVSLLGSLLTIFVQRLEVGSFSGQQSLQSIYDQLIEKKVQAHSNQQELQVLSAFIEETNKWEEVNRIVTVINDISEELLKLMAKVS